MNESRAAASTAGCAHPGVRRGIQRFAVWVAAGMGIALSAPATGQTSLPVGADNVHSTRQADASVGGIAPDRPAPRERASSDGIEQQQIRRRNGDERRGGSGAAPTDQGRQDTSGLDTSRVVLALAVVVGLIVVVRLFARWLFPGAATTARASTAVRVLGRTSISPRQQILLLQVGRRVIVVGDSGGQMSPLAELTEADEVAGLLGQLEADRRTGGKPFGQFFRRASDDFDQLPSTTPEAAVQSAPAGEAENDSDDVQPERQSMRNPPADLGLAAARGEITGLIERVKVLSQQFRRR